MEGRKEKLIEEKVVLVVVVVQVKVGSEVVGEEVRDEGDISVSMSDSLPSLITP